MSVKQAGGQHHGTLRQQDAKILSEWSKQVVDALAMLLGEAAAGSDELELGAAGEALDAARRQTDELGRLAVRHPQPTELILARQMAAVTIHIRRALEAVRQHIADVSPRDGPSGAVSSRIAMALLAQLAQDLDQHIPPDAETLLRTSEAIPTPSPSVNAQSNAQPAAGFIWGKVAPELSVAMESAGMEGAGSEQKQLTPFAPSGAAGGWSGAAIHAVAKSHEPDATGLAPGIKQFPYPRQGMIRRFRSLLLACWVVVIGYVGMVLVNFYQLAQIHPDLWADWSLLVHAFVPPTLHAGGPISSAVTIGVGVLLFALLAGSVWAAIDRAREARYQRSVGMDARVARAAASGDEALSRDANRDPTGLTKSTGQPRAFVSYSHDDAQFALRFIADLKGMGVDVCDDGAVSGERPFLDGIDDALQHCEWLLVILTPHAMTSQSVHIEVESAQKRVHERSMHGVIAILAEPFLQDTIPRMWETLPRFDAIHDYNGALAGVLRTMTS